MRDSEIGSPDRINKSVWTMLAILGSTILITMYGETMLLPAIGDIIEEFDISYSTSSWILTAYLISGAVMTPIAGKLSDIYGRKKMVLIIFIIYIIGIALGGISNNIYMLILARVIQGIGISMFPIAFGIIRDQFPVSKIAIGVGIFSSMFAAGSVVGMAIGGTIIKNFGWQATFFTIIPIAIILWVVIQKSIRNDNRSQVIKEINLEGKEEYSSNLKKKLGTISRRRKQHIDIKGAISLAFTISAFLLTLTYFANVNSEDHEATSTDLMILMALIVLTIVSILTFVVVEKRAKEPLIPLKLITD